MSGVTKKTSKVKKTNENEGSGAAESVTKRKRNRKYLTTTNKTHLKALTTFFVTTTFLLHHATAEKYIGMNHCCYFHGYMARQYYRYILKVSKSEKQFFLKFHCPKNERNI